jgi:hypothetical protein
MVKQNSESGGKMPPPLTLELDKNNQASPRTASFKLQSVPTDPASAKINKMITILDGSEEFCPTIQWVRKLNIVLDGLNLLTGPAQQNLVRQLLVGQATTTYRTVVRRLLDKEHDRLK